MKLVYSTKQARVSKLFRPGRQVRRVMASATNPLLLAFAVCAVLYLVHPFDSATATVPQSSRATLAVPVDFPDSGYADSGYVYFPSQFVNRGVSADEWIEQF